MLLVLKSNLLSKLNVERSVGASLSAHVLGFSVAKLSENPGMREDAYSDTSEDASSVPTTWTLCIHRRIPLGHVCGKPLYNPATINGISRRVPRLKYHTQDPKQWIGWPLWDQMKLGTWEKYHSRCFFLGPVQVSLLPTMSFADCAMSSTPQVCRGRFPTKLFRLRFREGCGRAGGPWHHGIPSSRTWTLEVSIKSDFFGGAYLVHDSGQIFCRTMAELALTPVGVSESYSHTSSDHIIYLLYPLIRYVS